MLKASEHKGCVSILTGKVAVLIVTLCALVAGCESSSGVGDGSEAPVQPTGLAPGVDAPSNAHGESAALLGVGHIGVCSGAFIDVGGDDSAPAYVLSAGHCTGKAHWLANEVFADLPPKELSIFWVNDFWDTRTSPIEFSVASVEYSSMHLLDLSISRLDVTVGRLRQKGLKPYSIAESVPATGSPISLVGYPGQGVLLRSQCSQGKVTSTVEQEWLSNVMANECNGITAGSSGSPMFDAEGRVFGIVTSGVTSAESETLHPCTLNAPCDVDSPLDAPEPIVYGPSVVGLKACFPSGEFDLNADGCILPRPPLPKLTRGVGRYTRATVNGTAPLWNVQVDGAASPFYRFKAGPVGVTHCDVDTGYSDVISATDSPLIDTALPQNPGVYVLCVHGGTGPDVSTSFTPLNSAAALVAEVDETPPSLPIPFDCSAGACFFTTEYPDYVKFHVRTQKPADGDCSLRPNDWVITESESPEVMRMSSDEVCATAEDAAGNLSEPFTIPPSSS